MKINEQSTRVSFDLKKILSGSVYIITLGLIFVFILSSLSELLERL